MMEERKESKKTVWKKPEVIVINLEEYEKEILANARSGVGCGCAWSVGCKVFL